MLLISNTEEWTHYLPAMHKKLLEDTSFSEFVTGKAIADFFSSEHFSLSPIHICG